MIASLRTGEYLVANAVAETKRESQTRAKQNLSFPRGGDECEKRKYLNSISKRGVLDDLGQRDPLNQPFPLHDTRHNPKIQIIVPMSILVDV